jgi:formylmethanofuran dehydrogenase subunit C
MGVALEGTCGVRFGVATNPGNVAVQVAGNTQVEVGMDMAGPNGARQRNW